MLDTNVVLDWLVFRDPGVAPLAGAITASGLCWLASPRMRDEFAAVLGRPALARWKPDASAALAAFDRWALRRAEPPSSLVRCRDAGDQVFVDLALAERCRWLVSHDRALLALDRQARRQGVCILTPRLWAAADGGAHPDPAQAPGRL